MAIEQKAEAGVATSESDGHQGAVEGDKPDQKQQGNPHGTALDQNGMPNDQTAICEDVIGANADDTQG